MYMADKKSLTFVITSDTPDSKSIHIEKRLIEIDEKLDRCILSMNVYLDKIDSLAKSVREIEERIVQRNEREINRAIRKFSMKHNTDTPIRFVPNHSVPLSTLLRSKEI